MGDGKIAFKMGLFVRVIGILAVIMAVYGDSWAWRVVPGGIEVEVEYEEPSTTTDGSPLTSLSRTSVYHNSGGEFVKLFDVPATAPSGGGWILRNATVPFPPNKEGAISFYAEAADTEGQVSDASQVVALEVDTLPPGGPRQLTIKEGSLFYGFWEPIVNSDGSPLTDFAEVRIFYNDNISAALRLLGTYPATSPNGGGPQQVSWPLETFVPGSTVRIYPRFVDLDGNVSAFPQAIAIKLP